jgi:hypothetical protein
MLRLLQCVRPSRPPQFRNIIMRKALIVAASAISLAAGTVVTPAQAGGNGGAVAAGVIGGLAIGGILGAAAAQPRYYGPPPAYVAEPEPVYVAPPPSCYWTRGEPVWDGYRGVWRRPRIQVCD